MRGGAALILLPLAACLLRAGEAGSTASPPTTGLPPLHQAEALASEGAPSVRGRLSGRCAGPVALEAGTLNQSRPLTAVRADGGTYVLPVPADVPVVLRWGCDPDGDGRVADAALSTAELGRLDRDLPLDLHVRDPDAPRWNLVSRRTTAGELAAGRLLPTEGLAPPDAPAPADGAVGPPLPDGPPPGAAPPTGAGPPTGVPAPAGPTR